MPLPVTSRLSEVVETIKKLVDKLANPSTNTSNGTSKQIEAESQQPSGDSKKSSIGNTSEFQLFPKIDPNNF